MAVYADVVIIGSGQAGVPLAVRFASAGKRVILVERGQLGGTCINTGCTPTKTMITSARAAHVARGAGRLGVHAAGVRVDLGAVVDRKDAVVRQWREGVASRLAGAGENLRLVRGSASFTGPRRVEVAGQSFEAETVILDIGARAIVPQLRGLDSVPWLDNASALDVREVPAHLVVVGGGYIGCELGQMFRRFGADVTIVDHGPRLLAREDDEISGALEGVFGAEGIRLELGTAPAGVRRTASGVAVHLADGREIAGSHLLVATGRRANTDGLGCEAAGVKLDDHGFVVTGDDYATSAPGVFAVGDATGGPQFTHTSWDDHRILFDRLMGRSSRGKSSRLVPYAVFTDPQVAGVGVDERHARERRLSYEVATMPFEAVARAIETDQRAGTMKVLVDPETERVLGARIVGAEAGELVHVFVALMASGASARAFVDAEAVHPTFAEGLQSLLMRLPRFALR
jgi:pyruvate/2-oxoglutarate dehydrogenase complex dihydrolipoamide dehydrogenase (E3) component